MTWEDILGQPSIHGRVKESLYKQVLDRVKARLEGWKTKYLNLAGMQALIQSVLNAIPVFTMQTCLLPKGLCLEMERLIRGFLLGGKIGERKCHLVKWETVNKPKSSGGLGLRNLSQMNLAFMMKLGWRLMEDKGSLWTKVLQGKYMCNDDNISKIKAKKGASNAWQGISKTVAVLEKGRKFVARNGKSTLFWKDKWLIEVPMQNVLIKDITIEEETRKFTAYWMRGVGWNWQALRVSCRWK